jgi:hypothetical protein
VPPEEPRCEIGRHCPSYDSAPPGHTHEGLTPEPMLWGEHRVPEAPPEHVCHTGAVLITEAWIVKAILALENRSKDKRRRLCRRRGTRDGIAATDARAALPVRSDHIPMTWDIWDADPAFHRGGQRQSFLVGHPDGPRYRLRSATADVKHNEASFYVETMEGRRVSDVPTTLSQAYQHARTLIRQAPAPPAPAKGPPTRPRHPGMTLAERERAAREIVAQHAQPSAADLRSTADIVEARARNGAIPTGQTAQSMEEAAHRLRTLADEKDRIAGDLPHGLKASGELAMRRPIHTPDDERYLVREERRKSEDEHGRDLLRALRRRTTLPDAERAVPLRAQGAGTIAAQALKEVQEAIDALPLSHRELTAAHGTHVYRQGKGFFRVVHPVVAHDKRQPDIGGAYAPELREVHIFNHPTQDAAHVVTHELGHAVDHALGHLRAGVRETAPAMSPHAPSQQADFLGIYQQHRTNPTLSLYMRSTPAEMFAEGYMMHHRQNERLRAAAPELHAYFCNLHEEIERRVRDAQREGRTYFTAPSFSGAEEKRAG